MSLAELLAAPAAEATREADGFLHGLAIGVVTDNRDPDKLGRVRVRLPQQENSDTSFWARVATPMAGGERGAWFLPEIGDEVVVGADCGDPAHLIVLGGLWSQKAPPPETNTDGANDLRLIRTRSGHLLRFDDGDDPALELSLHDRGSLTMTRDAVMIDDGNGNRITIQSNSSAITIESGGTLNIKSQAVAIEATTSLELKASGTLTIRGTLVQIN